MDLQPLIEAANRSIGPNMASDGDSATPMPSLLLLRHSRPTPLRATLYEPVVCVILQGRKETSAGDQTLKIGAGDALLVSHDLPVVSRITQATREQPYLAMILSLDLARLRSLYDEVGRVETIEDEPRAMAPSPIDPRFVDAMGRYLELATDPLAARVVGPRVLEELHFRLLVAPGGGMLRRLLRFDSHESEIARAIGHLRSEFRTSISMPDLARRVGMSESAFYKHFKRVTSTTPLQFQKQLRLLEARRLLTVAGGQSVSEVAFEVGYESASQFSREFARNFGEPPSASAAR